MKILQSLFKKNIAVYSFPKYDVNECSQKMFISKMSDGYIVTKSPAVLYNIFGAIKAFIWAKSNFLYHSVFFTYHDFSPKHYFEQTVTVEKKSSHLWKEYRICICGFSFRLQIWRWK